MEPRLLLRVHVIHAWLGSHKHIQAIQLLLEREAEHRHDFAGLFQNCFSLSDLRLEAAPAS